MTLEKISFAEFTTANPPLINRISRDGKKRLMLVADQKKSGRYKFVMYDNVKQTARFMQPSVNNPYIAAAPTNQLYYQAWHAVVSRLFFVLLSRNEEKLALVHDRDVDGLTEASELFGYAMEFNKYFKCGQFDGLLPSSLETNTGLPLRFVWPSQHQPDFEGAKLYVERKLTHNMKLGERVKELVWLKCTFSLRTNDTDRYEELGQLTIERRYPIGEWPKLVDFMREPRTAAILKAWLSK